MLERFPVPFEEKALSGRILAFGATRWTSPEVIVPWPNATYGEPSRIAAEDWSSIAALECCATTSQRATPVMVQPSSAAILYHSYDAILDVSADFPFRHDTLTS